MTDFSTLLQPDKGQPATTIQIIDSSGFDDWLKAQSERVRTAAAAQRFKAEPQALAILPGDAAGDWFAALVVKNASTLSSWCLAKTATALPAGSYRLEGADAGAAG